MAVTTESTILLILLLFIVTSKCSMPVTIIAEENYLKNTEYQVENYRLPRNVIPSHYKVELTLNDTFHTQAGFKGNVEINLQGKLKKGGSIILNTKFINIINKTTDGSFDIKLYRNTNGATKNYFLKIENNASLERTTIFYNIDETDATETEYTLIIPYQGTLHQDMSGFYLSKYTQNGVTEWLATTQFEPTHARRAFPCFDEPNFKAKFDISIVHPKAYYALGNADAKKVEPVGDHSLRTVFETTPIMSTYLVAFIVSKFVTLTTEVDNIQHQVSSQIDLAHAAPYGLSLSPRIIAAMANFTDVPYSISGIRKLDHVAIPDFSAGAMENWGLVTYRESALLWDRYESTTKYRKSVAATIAHELAHMWFGNLITCDWWNVTWLNEGFANYFADHILTEVDLELEMDYQYVVDTHQTVLNLDSSVTAKPMSSNLTSVLSPSQIQGKFDTITYSKGGSVIRMMRHFLTDEHFRKGIKNYMSKNNKKQFGNAQPQDLWKALSQNLPKDHLPAGLEEIMRPWTELSGFPVVSVKYSTGKKELTFKAERFYSNPNEAKTNASVWYVPITYTTSKKPDFSLTKPLNKNNWIVNATSTTIKEDITGENDWIIFNIQSAAYIRVIYEDELLTKVIKALQSHEMIHVLNRAQIIDDTFAFARRGILNYTRAFDVFEYLSNETEYYPWNSAFRGFSFLKGRLNSESNGARYLKMHLTNLMEKLYNNVTADNSRSSHMEIQNKTLAFTWGCDLEIKHCLDDVNSQFNILKERNIPVNPDLRSTVYNTAVRHASDNSNWDFLWDRFQNTKLSSELAIIMVALGCTTNTTLLEEYLQKSIADNSEIRKQDAQSVFTSVISGSPKGVDVGLEFLIDEYDNIVKHYGGLNAGSKVIGSIADKLTTDDQLKKFKAFIESDKIKDDSAKEAARSALKSAEENIAWSQTLQKELEAALKEKVDPTDEGNTASSITVANALLFISIYFGAL